MVKPALVSASLTARAIATAPVLSPCTQIECAASAIGDDTLQRRAKGRVTPESFSHGTSEQRVRWFRRGLEHGDPRACDTFGPGTL